MSVVLSYWERGTDANVVHETPGREVSTWVHALKADELSRVGGSFDGFWRFSNHCLTVNGDIH
jgi:hypothetical protein